MTHHLGINVDELVFYNSFILACVLLYVMIIELSCFVMMQILLLLCNFTHRLVVQNLLVETKQFQFCYMDKKYNESQWEPKLFGYQKSSRFLLFCVSLKNEPHTGFCFHKETFGCFHVIFLCLLQRAWSLGFGEGQTKRYRELPTCWDSGRAGGCIAPARETPTSLL